MFSRRCLVPVADDYDDLFEWEVRAKWAIETGNERLETDVSFNRNDPDFLPNLFNLSLSLDSARASPHPQRRRARHREREREKERRSASRRAKKGTPQLFSSGYGSTRIRSEEISNVVEDRSAEEWLKRAKKGLSRRRTKNKIFASFFHNPSVERMS